MVLIGTRSLHDLIMLALKAARIGRNGFLPADEIFFMPQAAIAHPYRQRHQRQRLHSRSMKTIQFPFPPHQCHRRVRIQ